jgi:replicative DNA helicase
MNDISEIFSQFDEVTLAEILTDPQAWAETFLVIPTTQEPFRANYVQQFVLGSKSKWNTIRCYRRSGKTYGLVVLCLYYSLTTPGCDCLMAAPAGSQVEKFFDELREFIRVNPWINQFILQSTVSPQRIRFSNGAAIRGFTTGTRTKGEAMSVRGQEADILFIDEAGYLSDTDWQAIRPIIMGDQYRRKKKPPIVYAASTCKVHRGVFYEICKDPEKSQTWKQIHVPIEDDPATTQEDIDAARALCSNDLEYYLEYKADWPEEGEGIFPRPMVQKCLRHYSYAAYLAIAVGSKSSAERPPSRTMGVDWDKFNRDGHGCMISVLEAIDNNRYRQIYREEIPQGEFTLINATKRVEELNDIFKPEWIYIDRGYGDYQEEQLRKTGKDRPETGLDKKLTGIQFQQNIDFVMPNGEKTKKQAKSAMVMLLRAWMERGALELPLDDALIRSQFEKFEVVGQAGKNLKFSDKQDHCISALALAALAMHLKVKNPYAPKPATQIYQFPAPVVVSREEWERRKNYHALIGNRSLRTMLDPLPDDSSFSRTSLGAGPPPSRSTF